jgi:2-octaprenylphenol hydroxylase
VLHPLAGQGVNLGFEDVRGIRDVLRTVGKGALADGEVWRALARRRRIRGEVMVRAMDAFRTIYASRDPALQWLRNVGVDLVNRMPVVKVELMREALGLRS